MRIRFSSSASRRRQKRIRQALILTGSICVLVFCGWGLIRYAVSAWRSARIEKTFQEIYYSEDALQAEHETMIQSGPVIRQFEVVFPRAEAEENKTVAAAPVVSSWPDNPSMTVLPAIKKLQRQNKDVIGWLSIPDMLEQAVVQRDNSYYLKRDYLGLHNANGALFLEAGISLKTRPDAYIIFGHNMKTGDMFGSLRLYEDVGYYRRHAVIRFSAPYEEASYVIFSIADIDTVQGMRHYAPFMQLPGMEAEKRADCIRKLQSYSLLYSPVQVSADDQLLLLVTCEGTEESRRVMAARRLREGESPETFQASLQYAKKKN